MTAPAVSVLLPYRDAAETLTRCLDSIAAQTFEDFELVAIDDGSTDASRRLLEERARHDRRIRPLTANGRGLVSALNQGMNASRAPLVARMDSDDEMYPQRLALQYAGMTEQPDIAVLGTRVRAISDNQISDGFAEYIAWQNRCVSPRDVADEIYVEAPFAHPSVCLRRDTIIAAGGYRDGAFPEDYELWLRLAHAGRRMEKLPQVLLDWRDGPGRLSRVDPRYSREAFNRLRAGYLARDPRLQAARDRLCIWGAGRRTRMRCKWLLDAGYRPVAWIDIDPRKIGNRLQGVPVVAASYLGTLDRPFVLSYVTNHGARDEICAELEALGLRRGNDYLCVG